MRPLSACEACRGRRKRCDRNKQPGQEASCTFCLERGLICSFMAVSEVPTKCEYEPLYITNDGDANVYVSAKCILNKGLVSELVGLYFQYVHIAFHNLFHRPSFEAAVKDGSIPKILLLGILGLSARFSNHPSLSHLNAQERGRQFAEEAERLLNLRILSVTTIQACLLLGATQVVDMQWAAESVFYAVACRMALILDLPRLEAKTAIEREVNIRVWWSTVATDTWSSTALRLPRAITPSYNDTLPMDERAFNHLNLQNQLVDIQASLRPDPSISLLAEMIRLNKILYDINLFNIKVVSESIADAVVDDQIQGLSTALDEWHSALSDILRYTPENLLYWTNHGCGPSLVILHINFNHMGQLLFYQYLHQSLASTSYLFSKIKARLYAERCRAHATNLCELIYRAKQNHKTNVLYPLVGHVLVVASSVQIYTLLFSTDEIHITSAKSRLEKNFRIITELQEFWPSLRASFSRLAAFNRVCLESKDSSFQLNNWMLRFLLDFARPVDGRDSDMELKVKNYDHLPT